MTIKETHTVPDLDVPVRLSDYVAGIFKTTPSRKGMKKAIKKQLVRVNNEIGYTGDYIKGGETIALLENDASKIKPVYELEFEVFYEDEYLAVVYKMPGMLVSGNRFRTIENALPYNLEKSALPDALHFPHPIHRLDYPTSGVLLVGKISSSVMALNKLFEEKKVKKIYHAIVIGKPKDEKGIINQPINEKPSISHYEVVKTMPSERFGHLSLIKLSPITGRRNQLRIHLANIGYPILGDDKYGDIESRLKGYGLYLHASALSFTHPFTQKEIYIEQELPKKFIRILSNLKSKNHK